MNEGQDEASAQGQLPLAQLQQELHAKELLLEALKYENDRLKQYSDQHCDPSSTPDRKSYDTLKRKVVEYQKALEQRDHFIVQLEAGIKQLMQKNVDSESKARSAEEHYSEEIQTLTQQVQKLTEQLTMTSHQHQAAMRAAHNHFNQQLVVLKQQMRDEHQSKLATLREKHASEMAEVTIQVETLEKSQREEHLKLVEHLTHVSNSLSAQVEEEKQKVLELQREKEEWEVHKKELEAESEEREGLRKSLSEHIAVREDLQEQLRKQVEKQMEEEEKMEHLHKMSESFSQDLRSELKQRQILEAKLEKEIQNAKKLFEQKTVLEENEKQLTRQLLENEEELAKTTAFRLNDGEKIQILDQEKETLTREKESLMKDNVILNKETKELNLEKELLMKEKETLLSSTQELTNKKEDLTLVNEMLTKEKEVLRLQCETLTKEQEIFASKYGILAKEKEALALDKSRILADKKLIEEERENLVKELEALTKLKDSLVVQQDILLKDIKDSTLDKDVWTREKENFLKETEAWATEKENLLTEKESLLLGRRNLVVEKEALIKENSALNQQLEILRSEKEIEIENKEKLITSLDTLMSEKNVLAEKNDNYITEKNLWTKERTTLLCKIEDCAKETDDLRAEKGFLLTEKKTFLIAKETWDKERQDLSHQIDALFTEKNDWSAKEELLNKKNESLSTKIVVLTEQHKNLVIEKENLSQQKESLSNEQEILIEEKKSLMKQVQSLSVERENLVQLNEEFNERNNIMLNKENESCQITDLQSEKEEVTHFEDKTNKEGLEEFKSSKGEMEVGPVEKKQLEEKCAHIQAELKELQEKYFQMVTKLEHVEGYKEKLVSKDLELQYLKENLMEKVPLKEKNIEDLREMYEKKCSQKDCELKELSEKIAIKEKDLIELKKENKGMEILRENVLCLLERLQSGEEERKKIEGECEDKCGRLNTLLRNVDAKLCEAASLLSNPKIRAGETVQAAGPRHHLEKAHSEIYKEHENHPFNLRKHETTHRDMCERMEETCKQSEELDDMRGKPEEGKENEEALAKNLNILEKEKKLLTSEAEIMHKKIQDQCFSITSLQNEKSRLGQHISQLERDRSVFGAKETQYLKDNLNLQEELSTLRANVTTLKKKIKVQEDVIEKFNQSLTELIQGGMNCPETEKFRDLVMNLKCLLSEVESVDDPSLLTVLYQELKTQWKYQHSTLSHLIDLQQNTDNLLQEKLQTDLENITLSSKLDYLRHNATQTQVGIDENFEKITPGEGEGNENEDSMLKRIREENKMLKQCMDTKSLLLRLERLHLLRPKPDFERELNLCLRERKAVMQVVRKWLESFTAQWKKCTEAHSFGHVFIEALAACIEDLSGYLIDVSSRDDMVAEVVVRYLQQAVVKGVSKEYQEAISATLANLELDLNHMLHRIIVPASLLDPPQRLYPSHEGVSLQDIYQKESLHQDVNTWEDSSSNLQKDLSSFDPQNFSHDHLTERVEHLITVRTALVDAANEFNEELEDVLGQRLAFLMEQLQKVSQPKEVGQEYTGRSEQLQEEHEKEVQRLEAELAAKDQEALQHLQGLYSDRDRCKKTVGLLSHVMLQLLHYYCVAQSLTQHGQQDASSPAQHPPESPTPSRNPDLSFLSDNVVEEEEFEEEMLAFSDDGALATGLMGRTAVGVEGELEDAESALDGTIVSEGMMDDLDKNEQVRTLLERSYPQLIAILKGRWDRVEVTHLEKEVQELTISLQASAGMLRIFIHSMFSSRNDLPSNTLKDDIQEQSVKNPVFEADHSDRCQESDELKEVSNVTIGYDTAMQEITVSKHPTPTPVMTMQQDLSCISQGLIDLLTQDQSLQSFTVLAPHDLQNKERLKTILCQLCEAAQSTEKLKLELHHVQSLQQGLEEERHHLQEEVTRLTHYSKNLARELQVLKDQLEDTSQENQRPVMHYAAKMEATKDVRERVRAALSAKTVAQLERGQLEARVRELEELLETVIRESETALEALRARETDLTQQLEVADRQLKSARQFLEEHANERDQEVEELVAVREKLTLQLRERDTQLALQAARNVEVENLEQQLWKVSEELQEALSQTEELQVENRTSKDKICDLREIIQSLESQVESFCRKETELTEQVQVLSAALDQAQQQAQQFSSKVEELRLGEEKQGRGPRAGEMAPTASGDEAERNTCQHCVSLSSELQEDVTSTSVMFQKIQKRLRDATRSLEALQQSDSLEDISAQDVEIVVVRDDGRFSPATIDHRLEEHLMALECTVEVAIKRNKDLLLTIKKLQSDYEEASAERDTLQIRSREQLMKISGLEARLDEVRCADHPAAADMRGRLALLHQDLEEKRGELTKKNREVDELRHTLSSLREHVTNREMELEKLQSISHDQPQNLLQTSQDHVAAPYAHQEESLPQRTCPLNSLQKELLEVGQQSLLPPSLAEDLISEKNAEILELSSKSNNLMCTIHKVYDLLEKKGNLHEAQLMLSRVLTRECSDALDGNEEQDVLRREGSEQALGLVHNGIIKAAVNEVSPAPLPVPSEPEEESVYTQPSEGDFSVMTPQIVQPPELSQIDDVVEDMNKTKEATPAWQQEVFEATLHEAALEKDRVQNEFQQCPGTSPSPPLQPTLQPYVQDPQTATQICASVDILIAGLKQELEKSGQLDLSVAALMQAGESEEATTQATSILSDASDGEEPTSIDGRIQHLMKKIHKEGIEVLSLIDIMFLCKHCTQVDTSQCSSITANTHKATSVLEEGGVGKQAQLMHNLAAVEEELTKKDEEMKRKIGILEFQLEQEKLSGSEWKLSFESEKQHTQDLMEQLRKERLVGAEQTSEQTLMRSQLLITRLQNQKLQEENCNLSECQEKKGKQIENLHAALQIERDNFNRMSKVLSEERKVSGLTHSEQEAIIKDLRSSLGKERERIVALCSHFDKITTQQSRQPPTTALPTFSRHLKESSTSRQSIEELQVQVTAERERCGELERAYERERLQAVSLKEQAAADRAQFTIEVRKTEGRLAELLSSVRSLETEKQEMVEQLRHEAERLQQQASCIKELKGEVRRLEVESRAQSEAQQTMFNKMREEGIQLHQAYTQTLTKLGEVEVEVLELRHELRSAYKELEVAREREEQLQQDLRAEHTNVNQMVLPTDFRKMMQQLYGCYLQSEHWRKALMWQKQYLMLVIKGYSDTEQHTLARLTAMAPLNVFPSSTLHRKASHRKGRFRVAVLVVVAVSRMRILVLRFQRKKRHCFEKMQMITCSTTPTPENSRPHSSSSVTRGKEARPTTPQAGNEEKLVTSFTGLTPPTRESGRNITPRLSSHTHRSLFQEESEELNQFLERLDTIHSVLGLNQKK